jgi:hypothetical protein
MFAKLYETPELGQILVKLDHHEESGDAEVRFYAEPDGLGVCARAQVFPGDENGWNQAEAFFDSVTKEIALEMAEPIFELKIKSVEL